MKFLQQMRCSSLVSIRNSSKSILAIETSFDNTAAAVIADGKILSNEIFDQVKYHNMTGGTDPRFAKSLHMRHLPKSWAKTLKYIWALAMSRLARPLSIVLGALGIFSFMIKIKILKTVFYKPGTLYDSWLSLILTMKY